MPTKGFAPFPTASKRPTITPTPALDAQDVQAKWLSYFDDLEDPRHPKGTLHPFLSVVIIGVLATIGGATGWEDIEVYAEGQAQWLETFLDLPWGIPKADCYRRVFVQIKPETLASCFQRWVSEIVKDTGGQVIPIDGKTIRGSYDRGLQQSALHGAYAVDGGGILKTKRDEKISPSQTKKYLDSTPDNPTIFRETRMVPSL